jgi:hypothetical protein
MISKASQESSIAEYKRREEPITKTDFDYFYVSSLFLNE